MAKQPQHHTGFLVRGQVRGGGFSTGQTMALKEGYDRLVDDLAAAFGLIPASINVYSLHNGTKLWVHMGSQGDLDVVLAEAAEWGSHVISVEVAGVSSSRTLDLVGCLAGAAATVSQFFYLHWMITHSSVGFLRELEMWTVVIITVLANLGSFSYLLDDEGAHNHPFRQWTRPFFIRLLMFVLAPLSGDVLALLGCGRLGLEAPVRPATRDFVVKWGVLLMAFQDGVVLSILQALHTGPSALPLADVPKACLYATAAAVAINLPRRLAHFIVGTCEAAYREKEELTDDAQISMFANQRMAARQAPMETPKTHSMAPPTPPKPTPPKPTPPKRPPATPPASSKRPPAASKATPKGGKPTKPGGKKGMV